jgi:acyl-CoA reductase-like NAD-dependent aldehyde dehydrogenase
MLKIIKTPKCYVGGAFIRSESGRVRPWLDAEGRLLAQLPLCSRKDLRNAVEAAAKAGPSWAARSGYNRGQILYRLAEMLEARAAEMTAALHAGGMPHAAAETETRASLDLIVHYAGWTDKFEALLGSVNPVSGPYFNFTLTEPVGITGVIAPDSAPLLALLALLLPAITTGGTVVALASPTAPYPSILLGEMLATSDLPGGVANLLAGSRSELLPTFASHEHLRAVSAALTPDEARSLELAAADSMKRVILHPPDADWHAARHDSLRSLANLVEYKTVWHPIGA